ncbi:hypothetical protein ACPWT1_02795 [Ramlibacter sp. MMS24-I3-19]|uniref:hypothetical protein n=1 Tax=Ramlibacter sp. MMS24-I3-19 TaxID=3416606 RepID=UPI003CFD2732
MNPESTHAIPSSPLTDALRAIYGTASALNEFMNSHIAALKASDDATISRTGDLLAEAKSGFMIGYVTPVAVIAVGQLLLGNPLTAAVSAVTMAVSPVAITCAAVGAIWMGWRALKPSEQARILETVKAGLGLSIAVVTSVIEFVAKQAHALFGKPQIAVLREMVRAEAANFGRSLAQVTGSAVDAMLDLLPRKPATPEGDDQTLTEVLWSMDKRELTGMLRDTFGRRRNLEEMEAPELRRLLVASFSDAAAYSWPWAAAPTYPETVALVAKQLKLPSSSRVHVRELERMILFKVVELSLEKLDESQKADVVTRVQAELGARGIEQRIAFQEIVSFVKTGGVDIGGTLGGLVLAGPGIYGVVGLNFLQFVVLKGIILSSGYFAGGAALMGFGTGGLMLAMAGWAGPVGAGLAFLFTAYSIAGPAYRKLVPAVCMIAAKRLELSSRERPNEG